MKKQLMALCSLVASSAVMATSIDLSISQHSIGFGVDSAINSQSATSFSGLYHEKKGGMIDWGVKATSQSGGFSGSVGLKAIVYDLSGDSNVGWGLAPGGSVAMDITRAMRVEGEYYYAPSILSFSRTESIKQFDSRFVFSPMDNADLYVGYRYYKFNVSDRGSRTLHDGGYVGMSFRI